MATENKKLKYYTMLVAVNFHYIRETFDGSYPSIFGVTPKQFLDQLDIMGRSASFLGISEIVDIIERRKSLPNRAIIITFDDGLKEQYKLAWPILKKKGIPAIFFVNTKPVAEDFITIAHKIHIIRAYTHPEKIISILKELLEERDITFGLPNKETARTVYKYDDLKNAQLKYFLNFNLDRKIQEEVINQCFTGLGFNETEISSKLYVDKEMVKELSGAGVLGTHGHAHLPLGLLDYKSMKNDIETSVEKLKEWTGKRIRALSYPFGFKEACGDHAAKCAKNNGIKFAFTMERAVNRNIDNPMFLARFNNNDVPGGNKYLNEDKFWNNA